MYMGMGVDKCEMGVSMYTDNNIKAFFLDYDTGIVITFTCLLSEHTHKHTAQEDD